KRNGLANVVQIADPRHYALDSHPEACVRHTTVAAQIEIPLESFPGKMVVFDALVEQLEAGDALRPADDFAVAFRSEDIDAECVARVGGIGFHVESLHVGGIAVNHHGP